MFFGLVLMGVFRAIFMEAKPQKAFNTCDVLHDLAPFVQFKKREKHPLRGLLLLVNLFFTFF